MTTQVYSSQHKTRQQLDELETLLQRMLTLPLSASEPMLPTSEQISSDFDTPLPPTLPQLKLQPRPISNGEPVVYAWRMAPPPVPPADELPMAFAIEEPGVPGAPYPYSQVFGQPLPAEAQPVIISPLPSAMPWSNNVRTDVSGSHSPFNVPFVAVNSMFDGMSHLLGPIGTWLRAPSGATCSGGWESP